MFYKIQSLPLVILFSCFSMSASASPITADTKTKLLELQKSIRTWAPMHEPTQSMAQSKRGDQGDILQRAGLLCLYGDLSRCSDVSRSQSEDGMFWRAPVEVNRTTEDSFSRDHFNGVMAYFVATTLYPEITSQHSGDIDRLEKYTQFIQKNKKLCTDATDNRCNLMVGGWSMLGRIRNRMGLSTTPRMQWTKLFTVPSLFMGTYLTPRNYQMSLPAYEMLVYQKMGFWNQKLESLATHLKNRAPLNPMLRFPAEGQSEEIAKLTLEACPKVKLIPAGLENLKDADNVLYDFIWNGDLFREPKTGKLSIEKKLEERPEIKSLPTETLADGWDCLLMIQMLLDPNPFR